MDRLSADEAISEALNRYSGKAAELVEPREAERFVEARAPSVRWLPSYLFKVGGEFWAVEIVRNDELADETASEMQRAAEEVGELRVAVFVPDGEAFEEAKAMARAHGIDRIVAGERGYDVDRSVDEALKVKRPSVSRLGRIPEKLCGELKSLKQMHPQIREVLQEFAGDHEALRKSGIDDDSEAALLKKTFEAVLASDARFAGTIKPLLNLHHFERMWEVAGLTFRDHFFHSFQDFLLGCLVIDDRYAKFQEFVRDAFPGTEGLSVEYVWLLVSLYHDVGYLTQRGGEVMEARFGVAAAMNVLTGEREAAIAEHDVALKEEFWRLFAPHRKVLVSLFDHLVQEPLKGEWLPDTLSMPAKHALDDALRESYVSDISHGAASAMRLITDVSEFMTQAETADKPFLIKHVYLAALSIPFHDWHVRRELISAGINSIPTSRFPFAALLALIDSVQDSRRDLGREPASSRDVLETVEIQGDEVSVVVETSRMSEEFLREKRKEVAGVLRFFVQDGLRFGYPKEFL